MIRGILFGLMVGGIALAFNVAFNSDIDLLWAFVFSGFGYYTGRQEKSR